jgi:hypothetical protein
VIFRGGFRPSFDEIVSLSALAVDDKSLGVSRIICECRKKMIVLPRAQPSCALFLGRSRFLFFSRARILEVHLDTSFTFKILHHINFFNNNHDITSLRYPHFFDTFDIT